jgi:putative isomerase
MMNFSRRKMLGALAMAGASSLAPSNNEMALPAEAIETPQLSPSARKEALDKLVKYFTGTGPQLLREAEGVLHHPSVSPTLPGKAYSTTLWDWDTYWTSRGLFRLANLLGDRDLHQRVGQHVQGSLLNFLDYQSAEGRIPIMIEVNNPDPFGCLKKEGPRTQNQAKPVMGQIALLIADELKDVAWLGSRFDQLLRFYDSWTVKNQASIGLLVWSDDVAIGDDDDPTTFCRPDYSSANLMLNCLYFQDLRAAGQLAHRLNRPQDEQRLSSQARDQGARIQKYCWDLRDRFYYSVDVQCVDRRAQLIPNVPTGMKTSWQCLPLKVQMFTGFLPLWCGLATPQQASDLVKLHYLNDRSFHAAYGVRSLSAQESMYTLAFSSNPSNWLGPIWVLVNYLVWKGLLANGFKEEAADLADKTLRMLASDLAKNGSLNEYYHPDTGAALSHKGFMDWNMLVMEMV